MLRIAICDDREYFREYMKDVLLKYMIEEGMFYEIDTFHTGKDFIQLGIEMIKYKIIFLDVIMDEMDGIMTAKKIRETSKDIFIVFVAECEDYVLEGYKVDAVRYILKNDSLAESVEECMDAIKEKLNYKVIWKEFNFNNVCKKVSLERILYIESKLHRLEFHIMEEKLNTYVLYKTLNQIESEFAGNSFLRIHQSYLINMRYVKNISRYILVLNNDMQFSIPRARYNNVEEKLTKYREELSSQNLLL